MSFENNSVPFQNHDYSASDIEISLAKPNKQTIGRLNEAFSIKQRWDLGQLNEVSFSIPYEIDIDNILTTNKHVDNLKQRYLLKVKALNKEEWFVVAKATESLNDTNIKQVTAYGLGYQLSDKLIREWAGVFIDGEFRKEPLTAEQVLINLLSTTNWSVGKIDEVFATRYRAFDFMNISVLEAVFDVAVNLNAIINWDTKNKKIDFHDAETYGKFTGLRLSDDRYLQSYEKQVNSEEMATRLKLVGFEGLSVHEINPTGVDFVEDYSFFMNGFDVNEQGIVVSSSPYMSDELCLALLTYQKLLTLKNGEFKELLALKEPIDTRLFTKEDELLKLNNELQIIQDAIDLKQSQGIDAVQDKAKEILKKTEITLKEVEIQDAKNEVAIINAQIVALKTSISMNANFTAAQLDELSDYIIEKVYENEYIDSPEELLELGKKELEKINKPNVIYNIGLVYLLKIVEAQNEVSKIRLGDKIRVTKKNINETFESQIIGFEVDYDGNDVSLTIADSIVLGSDEDALVKLLYKSMSLSTVVDFKKKDWNNIEKVGNRVDDLLNNKWESAKRELTAGFNESVIIDRRGITLSDSSDTNRFIRMNHGVIGMTDDGGNSFKLAITSEGVAAEVLIGRVIIGENLYMENENGKFKFDKDGVTIDGNSFRVTSGNGNGENLLDKWNSAEDNANEHTDKVKAELQTTISSTAEEIALKATKDYEDLTASFNAELVIQADKIEQSVKKSDYTVDQNGVATRFEDAESRITQTEKDVTTKVSRTEFNNIQFGGRNLLKKTSEIQPLTEEFSVTSVEVTEDNETFRKTTLGAPTGYSSQRASLFQLASLDMNQDYTLSADIRATSGKDFRFGGRNYSTITPNENAYTYFKGTGKWERISVVFKFEKEYNDLLILWGGQPGASIGDTIEIKNLKYEKGNKPTDWTPAPEDVSDKLNVIEDRMEIAETSIRQTADDITLKASKSDVYTKEETDNGLTTLSTQVNTAIGEISIETEQIALRVAKTEVENIQIGGRNYVLNSEKERTNDDDFLIYEEFSDDLSRLFGEVVTLSYEIKDANSESVNVISNGLSARVDTTPSYVRHHHTFTLEENVSPYIEFSNINVFAKNVQLEKGSIATDWSPAKEEIEKRVSIAEATIINQGNQIELKVSQSDINGLLSSMGNLINDPATTGNIDGWDGSGSFLRMANVDFLGAPTNVIESKSSTTAQKLSPYFEVDTTKAYEVSMWIKTQFPLAPGDYFNIGASAKKDALAVKVEPLNFIDGSLEESTFNFYFSSIAGHMETLNDWYKITGYILPVGYAPMKSKELGENIYSNMRMMPQTTSISILFYCMQYSASGDMWIANPSVREVSPEMLGSLNDRVNSAESSITQQAGLISQKVSQTDFNGNKIMSMFNQTATTIKMQAAKIDLNGDVTIENGLTKIKNASITNAHIVNLDGGKITANTINAASIKAGLLSGVTIQTSSGSRRVEMNGDNIKVLSGGSSIELSTQASSSYPNIILYEASHGLSLQMAAIDGRMVLGMGHNRTQIRRLVIYGSESAYLDVEMPIKVGGLGYNYNYSSYSESDFREEGTMYYDRNSRKLKLRTNYGWETVLTGY